MSAFDIVGLLLGGIGNIAQVLGVIYKHIAKHRDISAILPLICSRGERIQHSVYKLEPLYGLEGINSDFLHNIVDDFNKIFEELAIVRDKVEISSSARTFAFAPGIADELKAIDSRLAQLEHFIGVMGMIGSQMVEQRAHVLQSASELRKISDALNELKSTMSGAENARKVLSDVCRSSRVSRNRERIVLYKSEEQAQLHLFVGIGYFEGKSGDRDPVKAARFLHSAFQLGKMGASYYLGKLYYDGIGVEKNYSIAIKYFKTGSNAGDSAAIDMLGWSYRFGHGITMNRELALAYHKMAAEGGNAAGMYNYAFHKLHGWYTQPDVNVAYHYTEKAVEKGELRAKTDLAHCYAKGLGVTRNPSKAVRLAKEAFEAGDWWATQLLAQCYEEGIGVEIDFEKVADVYRRSAESNSFIRVWYKPYYGMCLIRGIGVEKNVKLGFRFIDASKRSGNGNGWFMEAECHRYGYGVMKDLMKAVQCYRKGANSMVGIEGIVDSHYALGNMLANGEGVAQDHKKAVKYLMFSANRMNRGAQWMLAKSFEAGLGADKHVHRALHYFRLAANSGHLKAQRKAGEYLMHGLGVQRDLTTAAQLLQSSAESGDEKAMRLLRRARKRVLDDI